MSEAIEIYATQLAELNRSCETALAVGTSRILTYGVSSPTAPTEFFVVEDELSIEHFDAGAIAAFYAESSPLEYSAGPPAIPREGVTDVVDRFHEQTMQIIQDFDREELAPTTYHAIGRITNSLAVGLLPGGHVETLEIYEDGGGEVVTATTITVREGNSLDTAIFYSQSGSIVDVAFTAGDDSGSAKYNTCVKMFGHDSLAVKLFVGIFESVEELDDGLATIRRDTLATGIYTEEEIDPVLSLVRENALSSETVPHEITPERIARFTEFATSLAVD